jgi:GMP synthase (glutamine-hydrolysing)
MRCEVIRFVAFEDLGVWEPELRAQGYQVRYLDAGVDDLTPFADADLAICLGAPIDADDVEHYPVVGEVRGLLAGRLAADLPTLGVCLGAQLMALALGATLSRGNRELGWSPVTLADAAAGTPLRHLDGAPVLHWHQDTFSLPEGAELLASTDGNANQAFAYGRSLGFQFHPEADPEAIEQWLIGHAGDLVNWDIDPRDLRQQAREQGDAAAVAGIALLREYLKSV